MRKFFRKQEMQAVCSKTDSVTSMVGAETTLKRTGEAKILKSSGKFRNLLTAAMLLGFFAFAGKTTGQTIVDQGYCGGDGNGTNLTWVLTELGGDTTLTISGSGAMRGDLSSGNPWRYSYGSTIKTLVIGDSVTTIGGYAFQNCRFSSVVIPNSVITIGDGAFSYCSSLNSVTIGNSVTSIGERAFDNCSSLSSISIPDSVTSIGERAFDNCSSLSSISIPDSVTSIGKMTFWNCSSLNFVMIGNSVDSIENDAFSGCSSLDSINVDINNLRYSSIDGILCNKMQDTLFLCPMGRTGTIAIPNSVTAIAERAFYTCTNIDSVIIHDSVASIGGYAFAFCYSLTSVTIGSSLTTVDGVTTIGNYAFEYCDSLTSVTIGNNVASIGVGSFFRCRGLTSIIIPNSVTNIGSQAFWTCSGLISVIIGNSVTNIPSYAFASCDNLKSVTIGNSVTNIESQAFYNCYSLTSITCHAIIPPTLDKGVFRDVSDTIPVYIPCPSYGSYSNDPEWSYFSNFFNNIPVADTTLLFDSIQQGETYNKNGFSVSEAGIYTQELQSVYGCDSVVVLHLAVTGVGIVGTRHALPLQVYPNPVNHELKIKNEELRENSVVEIYDVVGQLLYQINKSTNNPINNEISIDVSHLENGIYFVKISTEDGSQSVKKVVKN